MNRDSKLLIARSLGARIAAGLSIYSCLFSAGLALGAQTAQSIPSSRSSQTTQTLRLDFYHTGNAEQELFSLDRIVLEPLAWPGNPAWPIDTTQLGKYRFKVRHGATGALLYSRGFNSIYGEWETTGEAKKVNRTFHESLRFPAPSVAVEVVLEKRDAGQSFRQVWAQVVDPKGVFLDPSSSPKLTPKALMAGGSPASKLDLLLIGDGYTAAECASFEARAEDLAGALFAKAPFDRRKGDFNVWTLCPPAHASGISRPSTGVHRRSPLGATYDAFGSERYVLTLENRSLRDIAAWAPYDFMVILVNNETYGGGGIFGLYSTVAAGSDWGEYLFVHEFGHHLAGLADEYYTSEVAYEAPLQAIEPWERNVTINRDQGSLKWRELLTPGVALPTVWPKAEFEAHAKVIGQRRREIRAEQRPEAEMSSLFRRQQAFESELLGNGPHAGVVGLFEGGNYAPQGTYRGQADCVMFARDEVPFCAVCQHAIEEVIDLYSRQARSPVAGPPGAMP